jgi:hypothetical protein
MGADDDDFAKWIKLDPPPDLQELVRRAGERYAQSLGVPFDPKKSGARRLSAHSPSEITADMLAVYEQMARIRCTCTPEISPPDPGWETWGGCKGCQRWFDLNRQLLRMLSKAILVYEAYVVPPPRGIVEPGAAVARMCAPGFAARPWSTAISSMELSLLIGYRQCFFTYEVRHGD